MTVQTLCWGAGESLVKVVMRNKQWCDKGWVMSLRGCKDSVHTEFGWKQWCKKSDTFLKLGLKSFVSCSCIQARMRTRDFSSPESTTVTYVVLGTLLSRAVVYASWCQWAYIGEKKCSSCKCSEGSSQAWGLCLCCCTALFCFHAFARFHANVIWGQPLVCPLGQTSTQRVIMMKTWSWLAWTLDLTALCPEVLTSDH